MEENVNPLKKTARTAGFLYLLLSVVGAYGLAYVPSQIMVSGNAAATANNILAHELMFRWGSVSQLISNTLFVFLVLVLYRLLKPVNGQLAKLMLIFVLVQVPLSFIIEVFNFTALIILKGEVMSALNLTQKQDLAMLFVRMHRYGFVVLEIFWGLWLIPFGQLVYQSVFIPKIFGVLLIIAGAAYITESFTAMLLPAYLSGVAQVTGVLYAIGEFAIMLWLMIKGVRLSESQNVAL